MTTANTERTADFANRFSPKLVDLNSHGNNITITFLLDGKYYTAERIRPDFASIAGDTKLEVGALGALLNDRRQEIGRMTTREARCEQFLLDGLLLDGEITFDVEFEAYLRDHRLEGVEPTNK